MRVEPSGSPQSNAGPESPKKVTVTAIVPAVAQQPPPTSAVAEGGGRVAGNSGNDAVSGTSGLSADALTTANTLSAATAPTTYTPQQNGASPGQQSGGAGPGSNSRPDSEPMDIDLQKHEKATNSSAAKEPTDSSGEHAHRLSIKQVAI